MNFRIISTFFACAIALVACTEQPSGKTPEQPGQTIAAEHSKKTEGDELKTFHAEIIKIAESADNTVEDGWYYGQDPRIIKSFYRKISPSQKADFAIAYHNWMVQFQEDLVANFKSYVPYSSRADFAYGWWKDNAPEFEKQEEKYKVLWAHESVQDANELWWRAAVNLQTVHPDSGLTIAHDEEQRMLAHFMDNEATQSTISEQIWKRNHKSGSH